MQVSINYFPFVLWKCHLPSVLCHFQSPILLYSRYLDQLALNQEEKTDKHRFLVQSKVIDEDLYSRLLQLDSTARAEEVL
ncbi:hypothetical protein EON65_40350 [archaeon]|nr:MAG: hypothetical protein EON65_40350 [archaeon]